MERLLSRLPTEVQLMVLKEVDCPSSLLRLLEASPWAASLFGECYLEITRAILSHSLHPQLLQLAFALLGKRAHGFQGMDSLRASLGSAKSSGPKSLTHPLKVGGHSLQAAMSVLETAAWIQKTAWAILGRLLDWTNSLRFFHPKGAKPFRPVHPAEVEYWRDPRNWSHQQPAAAVEYEPTKCWTPSWMEAYRVHRALWRFMLYREHADVTQDGRNPFFMVRRRGTVPEEACVSKFWRHLPDSELDELRSILCAYEMESQEEGSDQGGVRLGPPPPPGLFCALQPPDGAIDHPCQNTHHPVENPRVTEQIGPGCYFLHTTGLGDSRSMLGPSDFAAFKRIGMHIWDNDRLSGLELLNDHNKNPGRSSGTKTKKPMTRDQMLFTWKMLAYKNFY